MPEIDPTGDDTAQTETFLFGGVRLASGALAYLSGYALYFAGALGMVRWWHTSARDRKEKFSVWPLVVALIFGSILQFLWPHKPGPDGMVFGVIPLVVAAAAVQIVSPWTVPVPAQAKRKQRVQVA
jgi:hypothetical protein